MLRKRSGVVRQSSSAESSPTRVTGVQTPVVASPTHITGVEVATSRLLLSEPVFHAQLRPESPEARESPPTRLLLPHDRPAQLLEAVDDAVDTAATQLLRKAMQLVSNDQSESINRHRSSPPSKATLAEKNMLPSTTSSILSLSPLSIFDKGLDAITGVGKMVEGFAMSLDNVIGSAIEDWNGGTVQENKGALQSRHQTVMRQDSGTKARSKRNSTRRTAGNAHKNEQWSDFDMPAEEEESNELPAPCLSGMNVRKRDLGNRDAEVQQWRRRAQLLQKELQRLRAQREEWRRIGADYELLKENMKRNSSICDDTAHAPHPYCGHKPHSKHATGVLGDEADALAAEQIARQIETLLAEKAMLAQDNDRLCREKASLLELLEYTVGQVSAEVGEDEIFGDENHNYEAVQQEQHAGQEVCV